MKFKYTLKAYLVMTLVTGVISVALYLLIPSDPKNAWLFGLSKSRVVILSTGILTVGLVFFFTRVILKNESWYSRINQSLEKNLNIDGHLTTGFVVSLVGLAGGIHYLFVTLTSTDQFLLGYFIRLAPWIFWLTTICGQNLIFIIFGNIERWKSYIKSHGLAFLSLSVILIIGFSFHGYLWELEPKDWDTYKMFNQDNKFDLDQQDIYFIYTEGGRLQQGQNPYERVLENSDDMGWNRGYATYFPIFYYLTWLSREIGLEDFLIWLWFWRVVFLLFNLGIAYILFYIPYYQFHSIALASFAALFWLFNRWTLHLTMIYHIDFIAIFFFLLSLIFWPKHKKISLLAFGLSLGVKQIAIFVIPLYLIWIWQSIENRSLKQFITLVFVMGAIPLIASIPFLVWNADGFIKSVLISATRISESHFGIPSVDTLIGLDGLLAKLPMLGLMFLTFYLAWIKKINKYVAALLIMVVFTDFNSVLFRQYMTWVVPLIPLSVCSLIIKEDKGELKNRG